jgi:hypothetical protein
MANVQDITTQELAISAAVSTIAPDDTLLIKSDGVAGRLYEPCTISTGLAIIGNSGAKAIVATGGGTPGAHHLTHEPGGGDEVGVIALRQLTSDPSAEAGVTILYVLSSDPYEIRSRTPDGKIRILVQSDPIN